MREGGAEEGWEGEEKERRGLDNDSRTFLLWPAWLAQQFRGRSSGA